MSLKISSELRAKLLNAAREADPLECCGLLMGHNDTVTDTVTGILPAANVSDTPHTHFEIDPAILIAAEKAVRIRSEAEQGASQRAGQGAAILGYYHSHPSGKAVPSATDAQMAVPDGRYWVVIASEELGVFRAVQKGEVWGRFDKVEVLG